MCKSGNQTIYKTCHDAALKELGKPQATNAELRAVIDKHGGCMNSRLADLIRKAVS